MTKNQKISILILIVLLVVLGFFIGNKEKALAPTGNGSQTSTGAEKSCPDEMIINKMPGTSPQSSYYIKNGERKEISDYDAAWVRTNCTVPVQEVF